MALLAGEGDHQILLGVHVINQHDVLLSLDFSLRLIAKIGLTFLVPYSVSSFSSARAYMDNETAVDVSMESTKRNKIYSSRNRSRRNDPCGDSWTIHPDRSLSHYHRVRSNGVSTMKEHFGYRCEYCEGTVREKRVEREAFKHRAGFVILEDVLIGVCDRCANRYYNAEILKHVHAIATGKILPARTEPVPVSQVQ